MGTKSTPQTYKRRTRQQWQRIMEDYAASGQTIESYCDHNGIAPSSFSKWKRLLNTDEQSLATDQPLTFIELPQPSVQESLIQPKWNVELELGSGIVLRIQSNPS